jgi:ectoine hydroxylase-related dioxygenase (phytanoyl-CoA dioxygenase family)
LGERHTYGDAFLQTNNLWQRDPVARRFVYARRFASVAATLLGCEGVRLYQDKTFFKEPGGGPTPWHQDQFYWPFTDPRTVTMWMPLRPLEAVPGSMIFASGSYLLGSASPKPEADANQEECERFIDEHGLQRTTHGPMDLGDATFHAGWTLHRTEANPTDQMRPVMTIAYVADGVTVTKPANVYHEFERRRWLGGTEVGQPIGGPLNPLLYP